MQLWEIFINAIMFCSVNFGFITEFLSYITVQIKITAPHTKG